MRKIKSIMFIPLILLLLGSYTVKAQYHGYMDVVIDFPLDCRVNQYPAEIAIVNIINTDITAISFPDGTFYSGTKATCMPNRFLDTELTIHFEYEDPAIARKFMITARVETLYGSYYAIKPVVINDDSDDYCQVSAFKFDGDISPTDNPD